MPRVLRVSPASWPLPAGVSCVEVRPLGLALCPLAIGSAELAVRVQWVSTWGFYAVLVTAALLQLPPYRCTALGLNVVPQRCQLHSRLGLVGVPSFSPREHGARPACCFPLAALEAGARPTVAHDVLRVAGLLPAVVIVLPLPRGWWLPPGSRPSPRSAEDFGSRCSG